MFMFSPENPSDNKFVPLRWVLPQWPISGPDITRSARRGTISSSRRATLSGATPGRFA